MFEKEATSGRHHAAFITANAMLFFDKNEVINNVLLPQICRQNLVVVCKNIPHFLGIIANSTLGKSLGSEVVS